MPATVDTVFPHVWDTISEPALGSDTDDEAIPDLSVPIVWKGNRYWVPRKQNIKVFDNMNDQYDCPPVNYGLISTVDPSIQKTKDNTTNTSSTSNNKSEMDTSDDIPIVTLPSYRNGVAWTSTEKQWLMISQMHIPLVQKQFNMERKSSRAYYNDWVSNAMTAVHQYNLKALRSEKLPKLSDRVKKLNRDMRNYWRSHEKNIVAYNKKKAKANIEKMKAESELREEERTRKKLDFLLQKTELYSHFMGRKLGVIENKDSNDTNNNNQIETIEKQTIKERAAAETTQIMEQIKERNRDYDTLNNEKQEKNDEKIDLLNPSTAPVDEIAIKEPKIFLGKLKSYQLKGLNWLSGLYDAGISGILADEMGLGKTIQSISFLSHLACNRNVWGPFIVCAPNSTLHQWYQEIMKFAPKLKPLPYWGSQDDRKIIRKFWSDPNMYTEECSFHVVITSYQTLVSDEKYFHRLRWAYMILDEAQAIKNSSSQRWKTLLNVRCRNRLLLTGTPIQNSMAELWSLLHFIMPDFFDVHDEFKAWFSKDVEGNAEKGSGMSHNSQQLQRLHMILKPFMLRRVKKDVEHEMAPKIEIQVNCPLMMRQAILYNDLHNKAFSMANGDVPSTSKLALKAWSDSLLNIIVQFRKVCNHPEIFQRRNVCSPFFFEDILAPVFTPNIVSRSRDTKENFITASSSGTNPIALYVPRQCLLHHSLRIQLPSRRYRDKTEDDKNDDKDDNKNERHWSKNQNRWNDVHGRFRLLINTFNIYHSDYIYQERNNTFSFINYINISPSEAAFMYQVSFFHHCLIELSNQDKIHIISHQQTHSSVHKRNMFVINQIFNHQLHYMSAELPSFTRSIRKKTNFDLNQDDINRGWLQSKLVQLSGPDMHKQATDPLALTDSKEDNKNNNMDDDLVLGCEVGVGIGEGIRKRLVVRNVQELYDDYYSLIKHAYVYEFPVSAPPIYPIVSTISAHGGNLSYVWAQDGTRNWEKSLLLGANIFTNQVKTLVQPTPQGLNCPISLIPPEIVTFHKERPYLMKTMLRRGLSNSNIRVPLFGMLLNDSGKLAVLDKLLTRLKARGHRVLIFSQMTKALDIIEDFMRFRHHMYFRLDGSTVLADRRDMVHEFQTTRKHFAFLLSTRAGGLGINLTGADTVIFFDNDWNPSADAQATDRVHRIGQTKQIYVYRLVCAGTVEQRIVDRARVKAQIQQAVYAGGFNMDNKGSDDDKDATDLKSMFDTAELSKLVLGDDHAAERKKREGLEAKRLREAKEQEKMQRILMKEKKQQLMLEREKERMSRKREREERESNVSVKKMKPTTIVEEKE